MSKLEFTKMVGAGNDFVVIDCGGKRQTASDNGLALLAKRLCNRKTGIGADGMLALEKSKIAYFRMSVFNADGSEAEMCGNGLRCAILYAGTYGCTSAPHTTRVRGRQEHKSTSKRFSVETKAGIYEGEIVSKDKVKVKMQDPKDLKLDFPINLSGRKIKVNFINTGVPHTVVFVEGLDNTDVDTIGENIRHHDMFKPKGTNVDFVEIIDSENIRIRTYERGVEGETLACGTGAVASAIITGHQSARAPERQLINVHVRGGILKVEFYKIGNKIKNVYLEGEAKEIFAGQITL